MWFTREEAAGYLRVRPKTIDERARAGALPRYRAVGTGYPRFRREDLDALMVLVPSDEN